MTAESVDGGKSSGDDGEKEGSHFAFDDEDDTRDNGDQHSNSNQQPETNTIHPTDSLSEILNTEYLDIDTNDSSCGASLIRCIASGVGLCCTPSRMLVSMRILKAVTFSFLVLTIVADIMYIFFVDIMSSVGDDGLRGMMARGYGVILSLLALLLELDVHKAVVLFPGFKGFIPRALMLFLIAIITNVGQPDYSQNSSSSSAVSSNYNGGRRSLHIRVLENNNYGYNNNNAEYGYNNNNNNAEYGYNNNNNIEAYGYNNPYGYNNNNNNEEQEEEENNFEEEGVYYNNAVEEENGVTYYQNEESAYYGNEFDQKQEDDAYYASSSGYDEGFFQNLTPQEIEENVPMSAVIFQIVTSWILSGCALCYFVMGIFCCDRFTAKAFMSTRDPVASTVIDQQSDHSTGNSPYKAPEMA